MLVLMMDMYVLLDLNFECGEGVCLIIDKGDKYLDFIFGIVVNCLGYVYFKVVVVFIEQVGKLWYFFNMFCVLAGVELVKKLMDVIFVDCVFFMNFGVEVMECVFKMVCCYYFVNGNLQ